MQVTQHSPPGPDELELSLFGPGYGEAIAIHLGCSKWVLVDSCLHPQSGKPAALHYLEALRIDPSTAVVLLVATHWHDDHVRGIADLLDHCTSATLAVSSALRDDEFLQLVSLYSEPIAIASSGLDELAKICRTLSLRRPGRASVNPLRLAAADRVLYNENLQLQGHPVRAVIYSLSPSDASQLMARFAFSSFLPTAGDLKLRVRAPSPNHSSVALWLEVGSHRILLGADLEKTAAPKTGWSVILAESQVTSGKAFVIKVPHHGSATAHDDRVWLQLLSPNPIAVLTPFVRGSNPLPSPLDIQRICQKTPAGYATAPPSLSSLHWRNRVVRETIKASTREMRGLQWAWGHIRIRRGLSDTASPPRVELFGDAYSLCPGVTSKPPEGGL